MKILILSRWFPYPANNGARLRIFNLIRSLAQANEEIDLISFTVEPVCEEHCSAMLQFCKRVNTVLYRAFQPNRLSAIAGFFSAEPRSVIDTYSKEMERRVVQAVSEHSYDAVIASEIDMGIYALLAPGAVRILEELELTTLYEQSRQQSGGLQSLRRKLMWRKWRRYVNRLLGEFHGCTLVSDLERSLIQSVAPKDLPMIVISNGVSLDDYNGDYGLPEEDTLIYAGALTYSANFDAVDFFLREIFPRIQARRPNAILFVTGGLSGVAIDRLPRNEGVVFTGYLDDVRPRLAKSWVQVVPLRVGGGTRLKILESLAIGTPVVTTRKGVEGLELKAEADVLVADEPEAFAAAVLRVLGDASLRRALSTRGHQTVAELYDWKFIGRRFDAFLHDLVKNNLGSIDP